MFRLMVALGCLAIVGPTSAHSSSSQEMYWRSRDGATRRDDGFHNSYISGIPGVTWTVSWIDHDAKVVYDIVNNRLLESLVLELLPDPSGLSPQLLIERRLVKIGEKQIDYSPRAPWARSF
jgi:hypothetical protein